MGELNRAERRAAAKAIAAQMSKGGVEIGGADATVPTLTFAYAAGDSVKTLWHQSVLACAARSSEFGFLLRPRLCESGPHLDKARNLLVDAFIQTDDEYLLFCDTDIVFAPQDVKMLLEADAPIAGALYFTAAAGMEPWPVALVRADIAEDEDPDGPDIYEPIALPEPPEDFDENDPESLGDWIREGLVPRAVAAVGCGLMLIKREVVVDVSSAYEGWPFAFERDRSEDLTFCLRAAELGYETKLVPAARVGHVKATVL